MSSRDSESCKNRNIWSQLLYEICRFGSHFSMPNMVCGQHKVWWIQTPLSADDLDDASPRSDLRQAEVDEHSARRGLFELKDNRFTDRVDSQQAVIERGLGVRNEQKCDNLLTIQGIFRIAGPICNIRVTASR